VLEKFTTFGAFCFMKKRSLPFFLFLALLVFSQVNVNAAGNKRLRIVSLAPSTTEILFALGLDEEIVGVSTFCNYPHQAATKEKIGTFSQPNIEKILYLRPDLVFCTALEQAPVVGKLRQLGFKVYVIYPDNFAELFRSIIYIGKLTQKQKEASLLVAKMRAGMEPISARVRSIPIGKRLKVFVEIWHDPLMTVGEGSFVDELIALAGGVNIAADTPRPYSSFSPEQVIKGNPDFILLTYMVAGKTAESIKRRLGWGRIAAVKNRRICNDISPDILLRPGPRLVEGLKELHRRLYP